MGQSGESTNRTFFEPVLARELGAAGPSHGPYLEDSPGTAELALSWFSSSRYQPDILVWSTSSRIATVAEPTLPWEEEMEVLWREKPNADKQGGVAFTFPAGDGCRGFLNLFVTGRMRRRAL